MKTRLTLSVCMITYNHEAFISQAIEGVLMQKTDFPIELVIGEDCSTDRTREICLEYQRKYPEIIRLLPQEKNLGMMPNFINTLQNCGGKYVALCEGDDYWIAPQKLQKQVDFLEANSDFVTCHHRVKVLSEDNARKKTYLSQIYKSVIEFEDLVRKMQIYTPSCVFRNGLIKTYPEWIYNVIGGDFSLNLLVAQHGRVKFLKDPMAVYRIHQNGVWNGKNAKEAALLYLKTLESCRNHFAPRGREEFKYHETSVIANICFYYFGEKKIDEFRKCFNEIFSQRRKYLELRTSAALFSRYLLSFSPFLMGSYSKATASLKDLTKKS